MGDVEVNLLGVFLAALSAMVVGSVWYARGVFGDEWMKLVKLDQKRAKTEAPMAMAGMFVLSFVMAYVLAHVAFLSQFFNLEYSYLFAAVTSGFWVWLGFVVPTLVGGGLFEQRRKKLMAINATNWLVTLVVMGAVIGLVGL